MEKMQDENIPDTLVPRNLSNGVIGAISAEEIYKKTKKVIWSVVQYKEMLMNYSCALKTIQTKFEVLNAEFECKYKRNPIKSITTRLKKTESIVSKLLRNNFPLTLESVESNINDVAGIRVICPYIDDIYKIADALLSQDDVTLIKKKDYIQNPKPSGYRSLHLIVSVPVFFEGGKKDVKAEVQIRTIAMDFWASLDHQMKYKRNIPEREYISAELKRCADVIAATDNDMLSLRNKIDAAEDVPTEDDILLEKLSKLDIKVD
jgi:putative GTP pyrophosphokinase